MLLAATTHISTPAFDWHAFAPELVLVATMVVVLIADLLLPDRESWRTSSIAAVGLLGALVPIATLVHSGHDRSMFGGAYVVDHYALALKAFFIVATYVTVLLAVDYIGEGDYYKGEFYFLLLVSTFGMSVMASSRDLITLFVALETISIPTFVLAAFRKHDRASNEVVHVPLSFGGTVVPRSAWRGPRAKPCADTMAGSGAAIRMGGRGFGAGGGAWTVATGSSTVPNCCRMSSLTASELSNPQA